MSFISVCDNTLGIYYDEMPWGRLLSIAGKVIEANNITMDNQYEESHTCHSNANDFDDTESHENDLTILRNRLHYDLNGELLSMDEWYDTEKCFIPVPISIIGVRNIPKNCAVEVEIKAARDCLPYDSIIRSKEVYYEHDMTIKSAEASSSVKGAISVNDESGVDIACHTMVSVFPISFLMGFSEVYQIIRSNKSHNDKSKSQPMSNRVSFDHAVRLCYQSLLHTMEKKKISISSLRVLRVYYLSEGMNVLYEDMNGLQSHCLQLFQLISQQVVSIPIVMIPVVKLPTRHKNLHGKAIQHYKQ
jgi:hypothetical protein